MFKKSVHLAVLSPHFKFHRDFINIFFAPNTSTTRLVVTFSQRVQRVDHQLEDGAPQRGVVEGGRAAASLQDGTHLQASRHKVSSNSQVT